MEIEVINLGPMGNCTYLLSEGQDATSKSRRFF